MRDYYWVRRDVNRVVIAALIEQTTPKAELGQELIDLAEHGPIERLYCKPPVIGRMIEE